MTKELDQDAPEFSTVIEVDEIPSKGLQMQLKADATQREALARRFDSPGETPKERARRERFLASRGFDFEQIRYALSCL